MHSKCVSSPPDGLLEGIAMYNRGEFYECHEVLEDTWRAETDAVRDLYQGILQIGVAFHHLRNGNLRGAKGLLSRGIENVAQFQPICMGVNTAKLIRESQACLDEFHRMSPDEIATFDWSMVPRIEVGVRD
jgi:uncharacterized protein